MSTRSATIFAVALATLSAIFVILYAYVYAPRPWADHLDVRMEQRGAESVVTNAVESCAVVLEREGVELEPQDFGKWHIIRCVGDGCSATFSDLGYAQVRLGDGWTGRLRHESVHVCLGVAGLMGERVQHEWMRAHRMCSGGCGE